MRRPFLTTVPFASTVVLLLHLQRSAWRTFTRICSRILYFYKAAPSNFRNIYLTQCTYRCRSWGSFTKLYNTNFFFFLVSCYPEMDWCTPGFLPKTPRIVSKRILNGKNRESITRDDSSFRCFCHGVHCSCVKWHHLCWCEKYTIIQRYEHKSRVTLVGFSL